MQHPIRRRWPVWTLAALLGLARMVTVGGPVRAMAGWDEQGLRTGIEHELAAAYGLSGTPRRLADPAERARKAVANRIRDAVSRIEANHPALGRHLRTSIRTGTFCCYEPERTVTWDVHSGRQ